MPVSLTSKATVSAPACARRVHELDVQGDLSAVRELEGVRQQVLQDLLQALHVGNHRLRQARIEADEEIDALGFRHVAEGALAVVLQVVEAQLAHVDDDGAGFDLRQVEDVVDERQQVVAGRMDRLRKLHLLARKIALLVLAELVGQDQEAVQRRPQLVRHVREELGLVAGRARKLLGLVLESLARLLDLAVLRFHLLVLLDEELRLLLQLLVGRLQLLLAALQLFGERLRLLEQVLGAHVGVDRVDDDADRFRELVEEGLVRWVQPLERRELEHAAGRALEHDRQHEDVAGIRLAQAGDDAHRRARDLVQEHFATIERALPDQALAERDRLAVRELAAGGVARQQLEARLRRGGIRAHRTRPAARPRPGRAPKGSSGRRSRGPSGPAAGG